MITFEATSEEIADLLRRGLGDILADSIRARVQDIAKEIVEQEVRKIALNLQTKVDHVYRSPIDKEIIIRVTFNDQELNLSGAKEKEGA